MTIFTAAFPEPTGSSDSRRPTICNGIATVPTVNVSATALRFFFKITLKRRDLAEEVVSTREPRRLPVVLSPEEVGRLLASARN